MKSEPELEPLPPLAEIEEGVLREAQEWARQRLQEKLRAQGRPDWSAFFPSADGGWCGEWACVP